MNTTETIFKDKKLYTIFGITLMSVMGMTNIIPAFPLLAETFAVSEEQVGLLITVFTLPGVLLIPVFGILADRIGRRGVLLFALIIFSLAGSLSSLVNDFNTLMFLTFLQGIGSAPLGAINLVLIADLFDDKRSQVLGYNNTALSIGTAVFPLLGGMLAVYSWRFPFLTALLGFVVAMCVLIFIKDTNHKNVVTIKDYLWALKQSIFNKYVMWIFGMNVFAFILLFGILLIFVPFHVYQQFGAGSELIGIYLAVMSISAGITSIKFAELLIYFQARTLLWLSFALFGLAILGIGLMPNIELMFIPIVIFGIAQGINVPNLQILFLDYAPPEHRAVFMSLNRMSALVGQTIAPVIISIIYISIGKEYTIHIFITAILLLTISIIIFFRER